ncbi:MAG: hypothetical protein FWF83_00980 [Clostridiales bacterium]|nr:hypothetical protein [Clostridiales bacterium]
MIYGTINSYLKQKSLYFKADQNLKSYTPASAAEKDGVISKLNDTLEKVNESNRMSGILTRLKTGKRLSKADAEYLRKKSPDLYRKYQMIEAEREGHRKMLKKARSRKDAAQLQQMKLGQLYSECTGGGSGADQEYNLCRAAAVREEYREYLAKRKKERLPGQTVRDIGQAQGRAQREEATSFSGRREARGEIRGEAARLYRRRDALSGAGSEDGSGARFRLSGQRQERLEAKAQEDVSTAGRRKAVARYKAVNRAGVRLG